MIESNKISFNIKLATTLVSLIAIGYIFFIGSGVIVPILLSFLVAILLLPIVNFINTKFKWPNVVSSSIAVLIFIFCMIGIILFISYQVTDMASDYDNIVKNVNIFITNIQKFIKANYNISVLEQRKYLQDVTQDSLQKGKETIGIALVSISDVLLNFTLVPIYTFLILLYKNHFILFFKKLFRKEYHTNLQEILSQIKKSVHSYISGLILELIFVSILTSIGLYFIDIKYVILLGIITGILNLIPYLGILIAGLITIFASLTGSSDLSTIIGIIVVNIVVQIIDNNLLVPYIINTKVRINSLVSIIGIIIGGGLAGIGGMFLAIPIIAVLKIIFDRIEEMEPWGYLLGDDLPKGFKWKTGISKSKKIKVPDVGDI